MITKIAITGGPSGGKTTLIETLKKEMAKNVAVVPEAASILFRGGFPRKGTNENKIHAQRAIYFTQKELEDLIANDSHRAFLVCDRGSLDAVAYWPNSAEDFFTNIGTSKSHEISRYQWVIHLDTAPAEEYDETNPIRLESYTEAANLNLRIKDAWDGHQQRFVIEANQDFLHKITIAISIIRAIFSNKNYSEISESLVSLK